MRWLRLHTLSTYTTVCMLWVESERKDGRGVFTVSGETVQDDTDDQSLHSPLKGVGRHDLTVALVVYQCFTSVCLPQDASPTLQPPPLDSRISPHPRTGSRS